MMIREEVGLVRRQLSSFFARYLEKSRYRWEQLRYPRVFARLESEFQFSKWLGASLRDNRPFMVTRLGNVESRIIGEYLWRNSRYGRKTRKEAHQNAGIFPVEPWLLQQFSDIALRALLQTDWLGFWQSSFQVSIVDKYLPQVRLCELSSIEPFFSEEPWSASLANKNVLVVHPFGRSILRQMTRRRGIYPSRETLPDFELDVVLPPQTIAPAMAGYKTWLDALRSLENRVFEKQFDVALIGCGAYGLPLAAAVKKSGRQAIHLGGALQLLFGIRGRRWDLITRYQQLFNSSWCRPTEAETPDSAARVEGGCYW